MNDKNPKPSIMPVLAAFFIGVILLWSIGKNWLDFDSVLVFLAGLLGVAIPVLIFGLWKVIHRSDKD